MLIVGAVAAAGCGGGGSKTVNIPGGGQVSVSDKLPDGWPSDYPVYSGAKVQGSTRSTAEGITGTSVIWETGDSVQKVTDFYTEAFKSGKWKSSSNGQVNDSSYFAGENSDGSQVHYVTVSKGDGDKTTITAIVGDKPKDSSSSSDGSDGASPTDSSDDSSSSSDSSTPEPATLPAEVKISKDFPTDRVPFPSGARITSSSSFGGGGSQTYSVELYVKDTPEKVADYFSTELPKHNWSNAFTSNSNGEYYLTFSNEAADGSSQESVTVSSVAADVDGYTHATLLVSTTTQ